MRNLLQMTLAVMTLAVLGWATWQGYGLLQQQNLGLDAATRSILIIAAVVALASAFMVALAISNAGDKTLRAHQFAKRFALYEKYNTAWLEIQNDFPGDQPVKLDVHLKELEALVVLLSSSKVIKAFYECEKTLGSDGLNTPAAHSARQKLLWAMREDLGQPGDFLLQKELLKNTN